MASLIFMIMLYCPGVPNISVNVINQKPEEFIGKEVVIKGILKNIGEGYFNHPEFVLVGSDNHKIRVSTWAPLEVPPPRPGKRVESPKVMSHFLGKKLGLKGRIERFKPPYHVILKVKEAKIIN